MKIKPEKWLKKPFYKQMKELREARETTRAKWDRIKGQDQEKDRPKTAR